MKKVFPLLLTLTVFSGFFIFWRLAPSDKDITPSLSIAEASIFMDSKTERTLTFETTLDQDELRWYSSDPALLTVKDGNLTALKAGQVTVWVTTEDASLYDSVTIEIEEAILLSLPLPIQPEVPVHPVEPEAPVDPELEEPEPEVPGDPVDPETEVPVEPEPEEVVTPPTIYTITITNETGVVITTLEVEEGSFITTSSLELPELFKGFFLEGETCSDDAFDLDTPITENLTLIEASFNDEAPCLQLDYIVLSGRPVGGSTLTVDIFPIGANVTISWYTSVNNRTYREIPGESGSTFTVRTEDSGKFIRVYVVSDSNPPVVRYDTIKLDVFGTVSSIRPDIQNFIDQGFIPISTPEDLMAITSTSMHNFAGVLLTEGGLSKSYVLINNINLSGIPNWTPLGNSSNPFTGHFEGNDYTLSDLTILSSSNDQGLFGVLNGATISNLNLLRFHLTNTTNNRSDYGFLAGESNGSLVTIFNVTITDSSITGADDEVGGLIGDVGTSLNVENVTVSAIISDAFEAGLLIGIVRNEVTINITAAFVYGQIGSSTDRENQRGGLIGELDDTGIIITISNSINFANIFGDEDEGTGGIIGSVYYADSITIINTSNYGTIDGTELVGGFIGWIYELDNLTISNSTNYGSISGLNDVGGFIGYSEEIGSVIIQNSINYGNIFGTNDETGGFIGENDNDILILNSFNFGTITGRNDVGGFIGENDGDITISNSHNYGDVFSRNAAGGFIGDNDAIANIVNATNHGTINGAFNLGGIIGKNRFDSETPSTIYSVINYGTISAIQSSRLPVEIKVGGLIGDNNSFVNVSQSANHATVIAVNSDPSFTTLYVGGLIGNHVAQGGAEIKIYQSYNRGSVSSNEDSVGGLIGNIQYYEFVANISSSIVHVISDSYNIGSVSGDTNIGGLVGSITGSFLTIENSYAASFVTGAGLNVGAVFGWIDDASSVTFTDVFYNSDVALGLRALGEVAAGATTSGSINGITVSDMTALNRFKSANWNIDNYPNLSQIWTLGFNNGLSYPWLSWQDSPDPVQLVSVTQAGFIPISSREEFEAIGLGQDVTFGGVYFVPAAQLLTSRYYLTQDLDLSTDSALTASFIPQTFSGTIDGQGFTVSHLTINAPNTNEIGLFSFVSGASISNLTLHQFNLTGQNFVGSLAGGTLNSTFNQLQTEQITVSGLLFVGGLVGSFETTFISHSKMTDTSVLGIGNAVGGLAGYAAETTVLDSVMINTSVLGSASAVGGLIGAAFSSFITDSEMTNTSVLGIETAVGGLVGYLVDASILSNTTMMNTTVLGSGVSGKAIGGLVGENKNDNYSLTIFNTVMTNTTVSGEERVGGLIGNANNIILSKSLLMNTTASAVFSVGGLVGWATSTTISSIAVLDAVVSGESNIGGLIGLAENASLIENAYSRATISENQGAGNPIPVVGGMVGVFNPGTHRIVDSYVASFVNGVLKGGLVGNIEIAVNVTFTAIFWNSDMSSGMNALGDVHKDATTSGSITAITNLQMQDSNTFTSWDFNNVWAMNSQLNGGFPYLIWTESFID